MMFYRKGIGESLLHVKFDFKKGVILHLYIIKVLKFGIYIRRSYSFKIMN